MLPVARTYGLGVIPWSPLAGGKLTGKYKRDQPASPNSREDPTKFSEQTWKTLEGLEALCRDKGCTLTAFANA